MTDAHFEPFLHLAGLSHDTALIAWGGFSFSLTETSHGEDWRIVDDEDLATTSKGRNETVGRRSEPYGRAVVQVTDCDGRVVAEEGTADANHVIVRGLDPDTTYRYRVVVDGEEWAAGERWDWEHLPDGHHGLRRSGRRYDNRFRTRPGPDQPAPLTFAVLGDYGIGIVFHTDQAHAQLEVARTLERAVDQLGVRLLLTTGDNIYLGEKQRTEETQDTEGSGDEDDDWYFSFYEPYRYVINRVPVYPTVGNHDAGDTEASDDRDQLEDNFYLALRFHHEAFEGRASVEPGICYRFGFGADVEFVSVDTSDATDADDGRRFFDDPGHRRFLEDAFPDLGGRPGPAPRWRIPFHHHPPFCAGPHHENTADMIQSVVPLYERAGVRLVLSGHEHNFQWAERAGVHYVISGSGGKLQPDPPVRFEEAHTRAWASGAHLLVCELEGDTVTLTPYRGGDGLEPLPLRSPTGAPVPVPVTVRL